MYMEDTEFNQDNENTQKFIHYGTKNIKSKKKKKRCKLTDRFRSFLNRAKIWENIV